MGRFPMTFPYVIKTITTWGLLIVEILGLVIVGLAIFILAPMSMKKKRQLFHKLHQLASQLYIKLIFFEQLHFHNPHNESFEKPGIIICNHQSLIENPLLRMLAPKIVMLTNKWVMNSPVFGAIARMADFPSADKGIDAILDELQTKIDDGYFIVVFPEGTRSLDGKIGRFHKGAFYIAEKLQLDIIPILFHATGEFVGKSTYWSRMTPIAQLILPRISPTDDRFDLAYSKRTKQVKNYMVEEYNKLRKLERTPRFYREWIVSNFYYKGPVLEWYVKVKIKLENNFQFIHEQVPADAIIYDVGCGYGYIAMMLCLLEEGRQVVGIDYDEEKIAVANQCHDATKRIRFIAGDVSAFEFQRADVFLFGDVLHYLPAEQRDSVVNSAMKMLNTGGKIIIRDGDSDNQKLQKQTRFSEFLSTNIGFNKVKNELRFFGAGEIESLANQNGFELEVVQDSKRTSNVFMLLKHRQDGKV